MPVTELCEDTYLDKYFTYSSDLDGFVALESQFQTFSLD